MLGTLLQTQSGGGSSATWIILVILLVALVAMYIVSSIKRKKYNQETIAMLDALKPGDKVKTYSGIYGTVVSIRETTDGKVITLETGDDKNKSFVTIDSSVIYCLDKKQDVVYDANGDIIEPKDDEDESKDKKKEATTEETAEDDSTTETEDESKDETEEETQKVKQSKKKDD